MKDEEADALVYQVVERLKARREELGMSVNKLSELAGMSHVSILKIESGENSPQLRTVVKLADALDMDIPDLLN